MKKHRLQLLLWLFTLIFFHSISVAQMSYTASWHPQAGNPGGINTEADFLVTGWDTIMQGSLLQNQWSSLRFLPFEFDYFGRRVSSFRVSANGLLTFVDPGSAIPNDNDLLPSQALPDSTIACFWEGFTQAPPTGSNDQVHTKVFGTAPNRQFWIRWHSFEWGPSSFQFVSIVLEETTHKIYLVDMYGSLNGSQVTSSVGLQANSEFAVRYGDASRPLNGISSNTADNSYVTFEPYPIEIYDMAPVQLVSPQSNSCGNGRESISIAFTNQGLFSANNIRASYSLNGAPFSSPVTVPGTLAPHDTMTFTFGTKENFSTPGMYELAVVVEVEGDGNQTNDTLRQEINSLLSISQFPYSENFEQGDGGWTINGENASWELAYPNAQIIQGATSGVKAWVTNSRGAYNANENSWIASPCFDLSNLPPYAQISANIWWETEFSWDGAVLQASTDAGNSWTNLGKTGDSNNWFNDNTIGALPGGSPEGWTGDSQGGKGSGGWVRVIHNIGDELAGEPNVRFRFAFGSDNAQQAEGFAFDDFMIATPPTVDLGEDGFYCEGAILDAGHEDKQILWSTGATTRKIVLNNLTGNIFADSMVTVTVTDELGFYSRDTILVSMTAPMSIIAGKITDAACHGDSSGAIFLDVMGGASPFTFEWSQGSNESAIVNLSAGEYHVSVSDVNGCSTDSSFSISQPNAIEVDSDITHADCDGTPIGIISLSVSGGQGGFSYQWSHGDTSSTIQNLEVGTYKVTIQDQGACTVENSYTIEQAGDLEVLTNSVVDASCPSSMDGQLTLEFNGGSAPYQVNWDHEAEGTMLSGLLPGNYSGFVTDSAGCMRTFSVAISYNDTIPVAGFGFELTGGGIGFSDSSSGAKSYFWDFGDGIGTSTDSTPSYFYSENGVYTVTQIVSNDCGSDTAYIEVDMQTVSIDPQIIENRISISPNPTEGQFFIYFEDVQGADIGIQIADLSGRVLLNTQMQPQEHSSSIEINLNRSLARGVYLIRIQMDRSTYFQRLILR